MISYGRLCKVVVSANELEAIKIQKVGVNGSLSNMQKFNLDQQVEEEGFNFSLGERKILALTRALVRQTKILILDEATSSVDYETDERIQARIIESFGGCTVLCIAHRLNTILEQRQFMIEYSVENGQRPYDEPVQK